MKFKKIILHLCNRLTLKNIKHFELDINSIVQFILGTNGSGKSSVLDQLTPLPANDTDFYKGGYKEIVIEKDDVTYWLISNFTGKEKHSFYAGNKDTNLNPGGTKTAQRELVYQYFDGLTPDLHDLQVGKLKFSEMKSNERRYWLTRISNTDYTYAVGVYNNIKEKHRDISGTVRTLKKRLVQEMEKIIVDTEYQKNIEESVDLLHKHLTTLLEIRKPLDDHPDDLKAEVNTLHKQLHEVSNKLIKIVLTNPQIRQYDGVDEINKVIQETDSVIRAQYLLCDNYMVDISKIDETISLVEQTNQKSSHDIYNEIMLDQIKLEELIKKRDIDITVDCRGEEILSALNSIKDFLDHISVTLPENKDLKFSRVTFQQFTTRLTNANELKIRQEDVLNTLSAKRKHMELHMDSPDMECPKCAHKWKPGFTQENYNIVAEQIEKTIEKLDYAKREIKVCEDSLHEMQDYFKLFKSVSATFDMWPNLIDLKNLVTINDVLLDDPSRIPFVVRSFVYNVELKVEEDRVRSNIAIKQETLKIAEKLGVQDLDKLNVQRKTFEDKLYELNTVIAEQRKTLQQFKDLKTNKENIIKLNDLMDTLQVKIKETHSKATESIRRQHFNDYIRHVQSVLSKKELAISEIRTQRSIVDDIDNQIKLLTNDEEALKILLKELSPVDGLIAEGMCGFINVFINQLNTFINKSWTYTLELVPCFQNTSNDKVDLDYKFNVAINGKLIESIKDISECSTGQREIINLAFKVMGMKHLGLSSYPLILDEFAATMDNTHRITTTQMLKTLLEQHSFSQLFMANHYDSIYGAFSNAQFNVMCDENVMMPNGCVYNKHLIMR